MKQETAEDMLEFAKEVCQKYSRVKTLAEETQMQWRQDLEMAADSKYPGEKEMYDRQAEESLARYTAVREWLELADAAAFRIRDSKAQIVVRQHCLDRIPLKAVEFENGKHMGKTAVFYHKKIGLQQFSEELFSSKEQMRQLEKDKSGVQFSHTAHEQLTGQLKAGLQLLDLYEDTNGYGNLHAHNIPTYWATLARKA